MDNGYERFTREPAVPQGDDIDAANYLERFFPEKFPQSALAELSLDLIVAFDIQGPRGGQWSCAWRSGELVSVSRGLRSDAEVVYRIDCATFAEVACGRLAPHDAFFAQEIEISGDIEKALKLAVLFGQFVQEFPYRPLNCREKVNDTLCPG
jgi:hypothetical protein